MGETNFGKITVPTKWDEVTLYQFQELLKVYDKEDRDILDILSVFINKDKKELRLYPKEFIDEIIIHLQFLNTPLNIEPKSFIEIDGKVYQVNPMEKLKFGEFTDCETILKSDKYDYSSLLGILARQSGEVYNDDFISSTLDSRIEMFRKLPLPKALILLNFFLQLGLRSLIHSQRSLTLKQGKEQAESLAQSIRNSLKTGGGSILDSLYAKIRLKKLIKSLKCI